jgi:hypothetical protein
LTKLDISSNKLRAEGGKALAAGINGNQVITELNISSNDIGYNTMLGRHVLSIDVSGIIAIADVISNMRAISSVNLLKNAIPVEQAQKLVKIMQSKEKLATLCGLSGKEATLDFSNQGLGPGDAMLIANEISAMGSISSVNLLKNAISVEQAQELVQIMQSKEKLTTLCGLSKEETKLDFSGQGLGAGDAVLIGNDISDMGALTSLNLSSNDIGGHWSNQQQRTIFTPEGIFGIASTFVPHFVFFYVGPAAIANAIKDMGAMLSVNLLKNDIGVAQAEDLVSILKEHPTLKSLCGNKGNETKLDMSAKMRGATDAMMLVPEIIDNGAMTSLNLASNKLSAKGAKIIAACLPKCM